MESFENVLLIFMKNPVPGKVKTRLGKAIGTERAYKIYKDLLSHTLQVAQNTEVSRQLWYSSFIDNQDEWSSPDFQKHLQKGSNLGERMKNAFRSAFNQGFKRVVVIGSDCPDLAEEILKRAFKMLETADVVIGPSEDGGYYLLGMNTFLPTLFDGINWSTGTVYDDTLQKIEKIDLKPGYLPVLNDVDTAEDLYKSGFLE